MKSFITFIVLAIHLHAIPLGETLFNGNCVTCHRLTTANSAPTIQEIIKVYKRELVSKKRFVEFMSQWVHKPNAKTALMPEAIKKYELMPELGIDKDTLRLIAEYLYKKE